MKPATLVTVVVVACLVPFTLGISLPSLFSGLTSKSSVEDEPLEYLVDRRVDEEARDEPEDNKRPTHRPTRPPLIHVPHPLDHPINPVNNPNHPLRPENLLPSLHLPHFNRETVHATKTVFVEVTDRVTIHPVCMTVAHGLHKVTPPCLPYHPHHGGHYHRDGEVESAAIDATAAPHLQIQATARAPEIKPTAAFPSVEASRYVGRVSFSEPSTEHAGSAEPVADEEEGARVARYVELTPAISVPEEGEIKDEPTEEGGLIHTVQNLLQRSPVTHYKTKTLWVTKVEKVLDTRVTATLLAKNCIPTNSQIPLCAPHGGLYSPGYHGGYLGEGTYTETIGGHFVSGGGHYTEKEQEEEQEEVQEQRNRPYYESNEEDIQ